VNNATFCRLQCTYLFDGCSASCSFATKADCLEEDLEELPGTEHLDETHHTVYVTLRVDHYEKPPLPDLSAEESADPKTALVYRLPVIHVVGESHFNSELDVMSRKMVGTVRAIGDGAIRLSLVSKATSEPRILLNSKIAGLVETYFC